MAQKDVSKFSGSAATCFLKNIPANGMPSLHNKVFFLGWHINEDNIRPSLSTMHEDVCSKFS